MSLDFILVKSHGRPLSMEDIKLDTEFKEADYKALAERFFSGIVWADMDGLALMEDMSFELKANDVSLLVTARGVGNTVAYMDNLAVIGAQLGVVVIDVQGSEILAPAAN